MELTNIYFICAFREYARKENKQKEAALVTRRFDAGSAPLKRQ